MRFLKVNERDIINLEDIRRLYYYPDQKILLVYWKSLFGKNSYRDEDAEKILNEILGAQRLADAAERASN